MRSGRGGGSGRVEVAWCRDDFTASRASFPWVRLNRDACSLNHLACRENFQACRDDFLACWHDFTTCQVNFLWFRDDFPVCRGDYIGSRAFALGWVRGECSNEISGRPCS